MNTQEFLDALEQKHFVNTELINKLRAKVEKTDKHVSANSIAKYLIDKGLLSKFQAKQLLTGQQKPSDDIEIQVPDDEVEDTNELLGDLRPTTATRSDNMVESVVPEYDQSIEVVEVEHEATMQHDLALGQTVQPHEGFDPLGDHLDPVARDETGDEKLTGFVGKKAVGNQWESKWLFIGFGLLGLFLILGAILWYTLFKTDAEQMWEVANEEFTNARYQNAIEKFVDFVNAYPTEERAPSAKVKMANCELRIPYDTKRWETTLERIKTVLPRLVEELDQFEKPERFEDIRDELAVIIPGTALGFTNQALEAPDIESKQRLLDQARDAQVQVNNSAYVPTSKQRMPGVSKVLTNLGDNISIIERQIQMEKDYTQALDDIQTLTTAGRTSQAFEGYHGLVAKYPELRIREPLREAMAAISTREADLVEKIDFATSAAEDVASPIRSTLIVSTKSGDQTISGLSNEVLVYNVNGAIWGIRAADGQLLWRHFVGAETNSHPQWIGDRYTGDVIASDARFNQLMRIDSADGNVKWKVNIGEAFVEPVLENDIIILTTRSGKVMEINPDDGVTRAAAKIPMSVEVGGVTNSKDPYIYQLGRTANLYVISTETMECREVFYVGHEPNSVVVPPLVISGHIVIPENGPNYCKLHVIKPTENGLKLVNAQPSLRLNGQVTTPFIKYSRWGLVMTDRGDVRMLEVNVGNEEEPVTQVLGDQFSRDRQVRHYLLAAESQLWTAGAGLRRYKIQKAAGEFDRQTIANNLDTFLGPIEKIGDTLYHVRRRNTSALTSISAVDSKTLKQKWRTDFAAPLAGPPIKTDNAVMVVSSQGDLFNVDSETIDRGFTTEPLARGSSVAQNLIFNQILSFDDNRFIVTGPLDRRSILSIDGTKNPPNKLSELESPADRPSCRPVTFGDTLLVPSKQGQVIRINPRTGRQVGAPFQPPLEPNIDVNWLEPAIISDGQEFMIADANGSFYLVAADGDKSLQKTAGFEYQGTVRSPLVFVGGTVFVVCRENLNDKLVAIPAGIEIEIGTEIALPGGYVAGPIKLDDNAFLLILDSGDIVCYSTQLEQKWISKLPADKIVGQPQVIDGNIVVAFQSGAIKHLDPNTGDMTDVRHIGQPIAYPPTRIGDQVFVAGADGTLHEIDSSLE